LFGQPLAAHYSRAGVFGLTNVIAVGCHGILANAVLPFGQSRMVWGGHERPPDEEASFIGDRRVGRSVDVPRQPRARSAHFTRPWRTRPRVAGLGGWLARRLAADGGRHSGAPRRGVGDEPFTVPMSIVDEVIEICVWACAVGARTPRA
jgi:hypothetical protein